MDMNIHKRMNKKGNEQEKTIHGITEFMRAAVDKDITPLLKMLCGVPNAAEELLKKDSKGRTALDWARVSRNYLAVTLILKVISKYLNDSRIERFHTIGAFEKFLTDTNRAHNHRLLRALKDRNVAKAIDVLTSNQLVREEIEGIGQVYFIDQAGPVGYTPLMLAAGMNMPDVVRILVERQAPLEAENTFGHTALTIAVCGGNSDIVQYLLFKKANFYHQTKTKRTVLHYACLYKKAKIMKVLLDYVLEQFAIYRVEGHSLIDFDSSRWTTYVDKTKQFLNVSMIILFRLLVDDFLHDSFRCGTKQVKHLGTY
jgi:hypothetical protein